MYFLNEIQRFITKLYFNNIYFIYSTGNAGTLVKVMI